MLFFIPICFVKESNIANLRQYVLKFVGIVAGSGLLVAGFRFLVVVRVCKWVGDCRFLVFMLRIRVAGGLVVCGSYFCCMLVLGGGFGLLVASSSGA